MWLAKPNMVAPFVWLSDINESFNSFQVVLIIRNETDLNVVYYLTKELEAILKVDDYYPDMKEMILQNGKTLSLM